MKRAITLLVTALLLVTGVQRAMAQGFRVYKSDGTVAQFSFRTDSIVFYDGIGTDADFGPFMPVNQCIVGTWYKSKSESITFCENGTTDYIKDGKYEFMPYQGTIIIYNAFGAPLKIIKVHKIEKERIIFGGLYEKDDIVILNSTPKQLVTDIVLSKTHIYLPPDKTMRLTASVYPSDADNPIVSWESSNEHVAQVINNGLVVGISEGNCIITCRATDGSGKYAECQVNKYYSCCPTWLGFTYTTGSYPNYVKGNAGNNIYLHPGDSIHLTAHQDQRGHLINATRYTWTICYDTLDTGGNEDPTDDVVVHATKTIYKHTNYDGYADGADDPVGHLLLPENALPTEVGKRDTIKFVARYDYSGQGVIVENGNIVDNTSYNGRITPQSGPTGGGAAGYFYFNVTR